MSLGNLLEITTVCQYVVVHSLLQAYTIPQYDMFTCLCQDHLRSVNIMLCVRMLVGPICWLIQVCM